MIMVRELSEEEVYKIVIDKWFEIRREDAWRFAKELFEAARVQQSDSKDRQ